MSLLYCIVLGCVVLCVCYVFYVSFFLTQYVRRPTLDLDVGWVTHYAWVADTHHPVYLSSAL
jgi:hypothetical protein